MNFLSVLRSIFCLADRPSLEEFILKHDPTDTHQIEYLEREYDRLYGPRYTYPFGR